MRILFLGTGAANWPDPGNKVNGGRRFCSIKLDDSIAIDFNGMTPEAMAEFGVAPECIGCILISHPHSDHFSPEAMEWLAAARPSALPPLEVFLDAKAASCWRPPERLQGRLALHGIAPWDEFAWGGYSFRALPANHPLEDPDARPVHFDITAPDGEGMLYALDGSWLPYQSWNALRRRGRPLDIILWEMTCGDLDDYRVFEHCNLDMISCMARSFRACGVSAQDVQMLCSHIMNGATENLEELERKTLAHGIVTARDGMLFDSRARQCSNLA